MFEIGGEEFAFRKSIDVVSLGYILIRNHPLDFGFLDPNSGINGLIGLDLLMKAKVIIDLNKFKIITSK